LSRPEAHLDAVAACAWLQDQYDAGLIDEAWIAFAHIERRGAWDLGGGSYGSGYDVQNFRDFKLAGPDVVIGFEGAPGHQPSGGRGGFGSGAFGGTRGGAGKYTADVGGLWDALLGEGYRWFNYASSDHHRHHTVGGGDFFPGEYQKTWSYVIDSDGDGDYSITEIAQSLRSGNVYHTMGDLVDFLEFTAQAQSQKVAMGGEIFVEQGDSVKLKLKFHSPAVNNNGDVPVVDHFDLIAGEINPGLIAGGDVNPTTQVVARFTADDWEVDDEGNCVIVYQIKDLDTSKYFRLRGTNMAPGTPYETDEDGNPLLDSMAPLDGADEAWADLWVYSNPVYVYVAPGGDE
jgi:hypothetical protein